MIMKGPKGKEEFKTRVREWAKKLDINIQALTIRSMKNKWASCSETWKLDF